VEWLTPLVQTEQTVQGLNLAFCELTSLLTLRHAEPQSSDLRFGNRKPKEKCIQRSNSVVSLPLDRVSGYVSRLLEGEANIANGLSRPLTLPVYTALLPTLWSLVNNVSGGSGGSVGEETVRVVVDHATRIGSMGASKRATVEFVGRLMLVRRSPADLSAYSTFGSSKQNGNILVRSGRISAKRSKTSSRSG
jgi:pre-rRNA-processing protein IPI1